MGISIDYYTNYEVKEMIEKYNKFIETYKLAIDKLVAKAFKLEGFNLPNVYIGIGVVTEEEIKQINNEYRKVDAPTDVLSFPIFTREELAKMKADKCDTEMSIGDIVLCMDVIERHAVEYGTGLFAEDGGRTDVPWHYQDEKGEWHSTSGMKPQPFMRPALNENREKIKQIILEGIVSHD